MAKRRLKFNDLMNDYTPVIMHCNNRPTDITEELNNFMNNSCSLSGLKNMKNNAAGSCFTKTQLVNIVERYNKKYSDDPIKFSRTRTPYHELWNMLKHRLENTCGDKEWCWLDQSFMKNVDGKKLLESQFKPRGPVHKMNWLSTNNIVDVMSMYEKLYCDFKFFGAVPIDFDDFIKEIINIDVSSLQRKGIHKIGIIFNLDTRYESGSHWVAMFADFIDPGVYYFDSYGECPAPEEIRVLQKRLYGQLKKIHGQNVSVDCRCNMHRHQYSNSECGVYSMYFILEMLKGRSFDFVTKNIILDEEIKKFRQVYFRPK